MAVDAKFRCRGPKHTPFRPAESFEVDRPLTRSTTCSQLQIRNGRDADAALQVTLYSGFCKSAAAEREMQSERSGCSRERLSKRQIGELMVAYVLEENELQRRIKSALRILAVGDTWLTPSEAATRARISKSHFLRLVRTAKGPKHSGEGRLMRFRVSEVDAWIGAGFYEPGCWQGRATQSAVGTHPSDEPARGGRRRT